MIACISAGAANKPRPDKGRSGDSHVQADTQGVSRDRENSSERKPLPKKFAGEARASSAQWRPFPPGPQGRRHWMADNRAPAQSATAGRVAPAVRNPMTDSLRSVDDAPKRERRSENATASKAKAPPFPGEPKTTAFPFRGEAGHKAPRMERRNNGRFTGRLLI